MPIKPIHQTSPDMCKDCNKLLDGTIALCSLHFIAKLLARYNADGKTNIFLAHYVND